MNNHSFVGFMQSAMGRILRVVVGLALVALGIYVGGGWGILLAIVGLVPLLAGVVGVCLFAPLFGYTFTGKPRAAGH